MMRSQIRIVLLMNLINFINTNNKNHLYDHMHKPQLHNSQPFILDIEKIRVTHKRG